MGAGTGSQVSRPELDLTPGSTWQTSCSTCAHTLYNTYIYTLKKQKHLNFPTLSGFALCIHSSGTRAEWKGLSVQTIFRLYFMTGTCFILYMSAPQIPVIHSLSVTTEAAARNNVCTSSPSGPPGPSEATAVQHPHQGSRTATRCLPALCPGHVWHLGVLRPGMPRRLMSHAICLEPQVPSLRTEFD